MRASLFGAMPHASQCGPVPSSPSPCPPPFVQSQASRCLHVKPRMQAHRRRAHITQAQQAGAVGSSSSGGYQPYNRTEDELDGFEPWVVERRQDALRSEQRTQLRLFLDAAAPHELEKWAKTGMFYGFTTNPTILKRDSVPCNMDSLKRLALMGLNMGYQEVQLQAWGPDLSAMAGKAGNEHQLSVAEQMGELAEVYRPSFVLSAGDNFYEHGLSGPEDPLFSKSFADVYTASGLQVPWLATLGNHDYGRYWDGFLSLFNIRSYAAHWEDTSTAEGRQLASRDSRWNCMQGTWRRSFEHMDVIFLDTMPLFRSLMWSSKSGMLAFKNSKLMLEKFEELLQSSRATFKLVVGHHPIRSLGSHCGYSEISGDCAHMSALEPLLKKHQVDAYLSGHDHALQLIRPEKEEANDTSTLLHIGSGAGGHVPANSQEKIAERFKNNSRFWLSDSPGFVAASLTADSLTFDFWDAPSKKKVMSVRRHAHL